MLIVRTGVMNHALINHLHGNWGVIHHARTRPSLYNTDGS
jgi:hypothetical protein